jgi:hypothetical protein
MIIFQPAIESYAQDIFQRWGLPWLEDSKKHPALVVGPRYGFKSSLHTVQAGENPRNPISRRFASVPNRSSPVPFI